jgi:hypothetical protein
LGLGLVARRQLGVIIVLSFLYVRVRVRVRVRVSEEAAGCESSYWSFLTLSAKRLGIIDVEI